MFIWLLAVLFYFFEVILRVSPNAMTQELMSYFNITSTSLGLMTSAYYYAYVPLQIPCGLIVDRFGPKNILTLSAFISGGGALIFGIGHSFFLNQIARFLIGSGAACAFISCLKIANLWLPQKWFSYLCGMTNLMGTIGAMLAGRPLVHMISRIGWQRSYYVLAAIGFTLTPLLFYFIKNRKTHTQSHLSTHLFYDKNMWFIGLASSFMYLPITVFGELWGTPFLTQLYHLDKVKAAGLVGLIFLGSTIGSVFVAGFANKAKSYLKVMQWGAFLSGTSFLLILNTSVSLLYPIILLAGIFTSTQVLCFSWVNDYCGKDSIGTGVGMCNALTMCSGLVFQPLLGYILDYFWIGEWINGIRHYGSEAYFKAMLVIPLCFLISIFVLRQTKESHYLRHA